MLNNFKVSFLFIGAMVGAGFATGREISLYFSDTNLATVILAGIFTGVFCAFFLFLGKMKPLEHRFAKRTDAVISTAVVISTVTTFIAMTAGAESLFMSCFKIPYVGLISGLLAAVCGMFSMKALKNANLFIVPLIIIMTVVLFSKSRGDIVYEGLSLRPYNSLNYTAMNMMLGGFLIKEQGAKMTSKNIVFTGAVTAVLISVMLVLMYAIVMIHPSADMPVFDFAAKQNMQYVCGVIIFLAIFSTMLGSSKVIISAVSPFVKTDWIGFLFVAMLAVFCFRYDFKAVVDGTYPVVGVVGILYLLYSLVILILTAYKNKKAQGVLVLENNSSE